MSSVTIGSTVISKVYETGEDEGRLFVDASGYVHWYSPATLDIY